jgi:hypothetical protein
MDPHGRARQYLASKLGSLAGTRIAGFLLERQGGKWGTATYILRSIDEEESHRGPCVIAARRCSLGVARASWHRLTSRPRSDTGIPVVIGGGLPSRDPGVGTFGASDGAWKPPRFSMRSTTFCCCPAVRSARAACIRACLKARSQEVPSWGAD